MNWIVWTLLGFVGFVLFVLAGLSYLRVVRKPHSAKMAEVQERANKKVRMSSGASATAPETPGNGGEGLLERLKNGFSVSTKMFLSLALVVIGGALWYMIPSPVHPTDVGNWGREHWLQIIILWGVLAGLVALNAKPMGTVLQGVLAGVVFMLIIGFPIWAWIAGGPTSAMASPRVPQQESAQAIPRDAPELPWAWNKDGSPTDISKWPMVKVPSEGDSLHVPSIPGGHVVWAGSGFTIHCVYADGDEGIVGDEDNPCADGNIVESYVRNEGETELYVSYAYARQFEK